MRYLTRTNAAPVLGEFLGTATLVMVALALSQITSVSYFVATSVAAALAVVYMIFGGLTGGHFNPAITFGLWTARRIGSLRGLAYIVAQVVGGYASWQLYQYFANQKLASHTAHWDWRVLAAEAVGTLVLSLGFASAVTRGWDALESAVTYGAALFVGVMIAATVTTAGYLNPAVALGSNNVQWVYILGPLAGGLVGINLFVYLFAPAKAKAAKKK